MFGECLSIIDWMPFRKSCIYDMCAASDNNRAVCTMIAALAYECNVHGVNVDWFSNADVFATCNGTTVVVSLIRVVGVCVGGGRSGVVVGLRRSLGRRGRSTGSQTY